MIYTFICKPSSSIPARPKEMNMGNLQGYWEDVKKEIELVLETKLNFDPKLCILGIPLGNQMVKKSTY